MTSAASKPLTLEKIAAIRHFVYQTLLNRLPPASVGQAETFAANLALYNRDRNRFRPDPRCRELSRHILSRHRELRVTPDIAETAFTASKDDIEIYFQRRFGNHLRHVAGFYFDGEFWHLNLPEQCAIEGYKNQFGFYTGVLCQPLYSIDRFFLLSSATHGGEKAIRMDLPTRLYYEQYKNSAKQRHNTAPPMNQASLKGWKFNGRRFIEPK